MVRVGGPSFEIKYDSGTFREVGLLASTGTWRLSDQPIEGTAIFLVPHGLEKNHLAFPFRWISKPKLSESRFFWGNILECYLNMP